MFQKVCSLCVLVSFCFTILFVEIPRLHAQEKEADRPRIAVLPFADTNAAARQEGYGEAISSMLMTELINGMVFQVIERNEIDRMMQEMAFQLSGAVDSQTAKQIGEVLGVDILVFGSVAKFSPVVETDIRLVDTESGEAMLAESASSESGMEIRNMVENLARKIESRYLGRLMEDVEILSFPSNATVYADGLSVGTTPLTKSLSQGPHKIRIIKDGYQAWEESITIVSGKNTVQARLSEIPSSQRQSEPVRRTTEQPTKPQVEKKKGGSKAYLWVLGAAAVGGAAYFLLLKKDEDKPSNVTVNVTIPN